MAKRFHGYSCNNDRPSTALGKASYSGSTNRRSAKRANLQPHGISMLWLYMFDILNCFWRNYSAMFLFCFYFILKINETLNGLREFDCMVQLGTVNHLGSYSAAVDLKHLKAGKNQ